jgi:hypothetical protein
MKAMIEWPGLNIRFPAIKPIDRPVLPAALFLSRPCALFYLEFFFQCRLAGQTILAGNGLAAAFRYPLAAFFTFDSRLAGIDRLSRFFDKERGHLIHALNDGVGSACPC